MTFIIFWTIYLLIGALIVDNFRLPFWKLGILLMVWPLFVSYVFGRGLYETIRDSRNGKL